ncbi:MAG: 4Fe-4S binding protein [Bacteroidales bacterium]|jgi:NAD-dependent dihydropyrimidine dehydrogenase PreA subunit|nr:4Fe-4S binding protein [Bacteroidales bacterium]
MKRKVIKIDEDLCNGCGNCVEGCHEGAIQLIDGKAVMVSDLYCDGLGACIGECPVGAIELIEKETEPYNEIAVMERISQKGEKVVLAHLKHLKDMGEMGWYNEGVDWCKKNGFKIDLSQIEGETPRAAAPEKRENLACGCPGSMEQDFRKKNITNFAAPLRAEPNTDSFNGGISGISRLEQWPVQLHLLNPNAGFLHKSDLLLASDCSAFSHGSFHESFLKNRSLAIACPKLDTTTGSYIEKLSVMIDQSMLNTITVLMMEVPCCSGLLTIAKQARDRAARKIPVKSMVLSLRGEILSEDWV